MGMITIATLGVGLGIYAATRTIKIPGQKLGDISVQTAKEGEPRLIVWGIVRPIGGNLVAVQEPPRIEKRKQKSGGKGGGSSTRTEHPHRTYAVAVCEGPITGFRRIWRNNKLVYDGRPDSEWGRDNNPVFLKKARFYLGDFKQMPSPDLEAVFGIGQVPAMRGTAYMVMVDEDLSDMGGAVPQWLFEVFRSEGFSLTSQPYEVESQERASMGMSSGRALLREVLKQSRGMESASVGVSVSRLQLRDLLYTMDGGKEEATPSLSVTRVRLHRVLVVYNHPKPEEATPSLSVTRVRMHRVLVVYNHPKPEEATPSLSVTRVYLNEQ